jgi:hypothetical protein
MGNSGNLEGASSIYEKASSQFDCIRSFVESYFKDSEHSLEKEEMLDRACYRGTVRPSDAAVGPREKLVT